MLDQAISMIGFVVCWRARSNCVEIKYDIFLQSGELYETVRVSGQDEEECQEQLNLYLSTKQDCYGQEAEE